MQLATGDELGFTANELRCFKAGCLESLLFTTRLFFKRRETTRLIVSHHHRIVANTLDRVLNGEIKRLIINIPPGYTKA